MRLHQKLAVVLSSAMAVSALPVVTMAASTNSLSKEMLRVKEDCEFTRISTANALKIKFTDNNANEEVFYLDLDNAEWNEDTLKAAEAENSEFKAVAGKSDTWTYTTKYGDVTYERQNDDTMKITVPAAVAEKYTNSPIQLPLLAKAKDGEAKVSVVSKGGETTVTKGSFVFATTAEKKISVSAKNDKTFYTNGKLSDITIEESYKGSLANGATFTIELGDSDYYFDSESLTLEGKYGFSGYGEKTLTDTTDKDTVGKCEISGTDDGKMTITLPKITGSTAGTFIIKDLKVKSTNKHPEEGDFTVDIKGDDLSSEKTDLKVAKVSEYGIYVKMKDDKAEDVKAGRKEEVEFEVGENVEDSMITGREFEMTLDNGHWDYRQLVKDAADKGKLEGKVDGKSYNSDASYSDEDYMKWATKINSCWLAATLLDNDKDWLTSDDGKASDTYCEAEFDTDNDSQAIPETIIFTIGKDNDKKSVQDNDDCDILKFKTKICVPINLKDKDKVSLKISGRGVENEMSTTAIDIINPFNVTYEQAVLKTGKQGQVSGSVTIKETDKDCLQKGDVTFKITKDNEDFNIYLTDANVEVSDGLKGTKTDITKGKASSSAKINLKLNRASKQAATITFKDMTFTTDRTVPQGTYDLEISGSAIDEDAGWVEDDSTVDNHKLVIKDFIKITTTNTEDITASGLAKGVVKFVIGENKYTLNDKDVTMDAPSYIQNPGYTMVSARYLAQAFGVSESNILFKKGVVTIFAGERTINLTTGSNIAVVNGNQIPMATKVVNKNGRTYLPASQLANLLGIESSWDSDTKTATFENK